MKKNLKVISVLLAVLNVISLAFFIAYSIKNTALASSNIFAVISYIVICCDLIYASFFKRAGSFVQIILTAVLFIINFASNYIAGLSAFTLDKNIIAIVSIALIYAVNMVCILLNIKNTDYKKCSINSTAALLFSIVSMLFFTSILIVGIISLFAKTPINTNTVNLSVLFIFLCTAVFSLSLISEYYVKSKRIKTNLIILFIASVIPFAVMQLSVFSDVKQADKAFVNTFSYFETKDNMRKGPYSFADEFTGIETGNFEIKRDVVYYSAQEGTDKGLTLRYDMYLPKDENAHKSVLVNLHGSGGNKDIGNYAHRNKYFASRGYVVFDLQFGDWNEKNTGYKDSMYSSKNMLFHIDEFFKYLSSNNDVNADLSSVFITGVSMGGSLASKYAYSYDNNLDAYNVTLKGIIPVYPGYSPKDTGMDNYLNYVDHNSVPCMIVMGKSDCIVRTQTVSETLDAYKKADNPNCFALELSYAGHGCDSLMTGRSNQMIAYYAEQFMQKQR